MIDMLSLAIAIGAGLIVISILTSLISFRIGAPLLLVFLLVGLLAGEDGIGGIPFKDASAAYFIGSVALAVILFDSGYGTQWRSFRLAASPALTLASVGVLLTALVLAVPAKFLLGLTWSEAMLLGAIVGSTDAAAVFFLLRVGNIGIRDRVRATLEIESGSNDPMAIFLVITLLEMSAMGALQDGWMSTFGMALVQQFGLGIGIGVAVGYLLVLILNRFVFDAGLYPVLVLSLVLLLFGVTSVLGGSGFMAVYAAGIVMGNVRFRGGLTIRRFQEGLTWLAQITMFLMLGLLATPSEFPDIALGAVLVGLLLIFIARPFAVWLCLIPFGFTRAETTFIAWVGLRGAVSILLAILPIMAGLENGQLLFNSAFIIVLVSLVVQGWTIRPMARKLDLIVPPHLGAVNKVELELPGHAQHELLVYRVTKGSPVEQGERIPRWARPALTVREGKSMQSHEAGRLKVGDYVYIFTTPRYINLLDRLFAQPVMLTRKDRRYFGDLAVDPDKPVSDLAAYYGVALRSGEETLTVAELIAKRLGSTVVRGDRILLGPIELVVREADDDGAATSVGLALEPSVASTFELPILQKCQHLVNVARMWWVARRGGEQKANGPVTPVTPVSKPAPDPENPSSSGNPQDSQKVPAQDSGPSTRTGST